MKLCGVILLQTLKGKCVHTSTAMLQTTCANTLLLSFYTWHWMFLTGTSSDFFWLQTNFYEGCTISHIIIVIKILASTIELDQVQY